MKSDKDRTETFLIGKNHCTGCNACEQICPKSAIRFKTDVYGCSYPEIDFEKCVHCGRCKSVCHSQRYVETDFRFPLYAYAAWSKDKLIHNIAASGGIASELYRYALEHSIFCMGTYFDRREGVIYKRIQELEDIGWASNSKYVQSNMSMVFLLYEEVLKNGGNAIFIGLPCQVAALYTWLDEKGLTTENLITVDLICHGVPPYEYLFQHLEYIEKKRNTRIEGISFRGPNSEFVMRCFNSEGMQVYSAYMHGTDAYYRGFCDNLNFRENCYHCFYARYERISDITIGDYSGLGSLWKYDGNNRMVSVILANTEHGQTLLNEMADRIELIQRHICEPPSAKYNPQLRHPSIPDKGRDLFLRIFADRGGGTKGFEVASRSALKWRIIRWYILYPAFVMRRTLSKMLPDYIKNRIKSVIRKS